MRGRAMSPRSTSDIPGLRVNRGDLVRKGLDLRLRADDLGSQLIDLLPNDAALALDRRAATFELADLAVPDAFEIAVLRAALDPPA